MDVPLYHNVEFKQIGGAIPEIIFLNKQGQELKRIDLTEKSQMECNQLLQERGFFRKADKDALVPPELEDVPYSRQHREL